MKLSIRILLLTASALLVASLLFASGCGDDDGDSGTTAANSSPASSGDGEGSQNDSDATDFSGAPDSSSSDSASDGSEKAQFVEAANESCRESRKQMQKKVEAILNNGQKDPLAASQRAIEQVVVPSLEAQIEEIRALGPPASEQAQVEAILVSIQGAVDEAQANPQKFVAKPEPFEKPEKLANEYGLTTCGRL